MTDEPRCEHLAAYFTWEPPPGGAPVRFAVVTAYNPDGHVRPAAENSAADAALREALLAAGFAPFRVVGRSADGTHQEPGWGFAADSPEAARPFSRSYSQLAFFWVENGEIFIVNTEGALLHPVAAWSDRLL